MNFYIKKYRYIRKYFHRRKTVTQEKNIVIFNCITWKKLLLLNGYPISVIFYFIHKILSVCMPKFCYICLVGQTIYYVVAILFKLIRLRKKILKYVPKFWNIRDFYLLFFSILKFLYFSILKSLINCLQM